MHPAEINSLRIIVSILLQLVTPSLPIVETPVSGIPNIAHGRALLVSTAPIVDHMKDRYDRGAGIDDRSTASDE
jgi:hypothetical protein